MYSKYNGEVNCIPNNGEDCIFMKFTLKGIRFLFSFSTSRSLTNVKSCMNINMK